MLRIRPYLLGLFVISSTLLSSACTSLLTNRVSGVLTSGIVNQEDPVLVRDGAPSYLLLIDGMIHESPKDKDLLIAGSRLYGAYANTYVAEPKRGIQMANKAHRYARRALCLHDKGLCRAIAQPYRTLQLQLRKAKVSSVPYLYAYATSLVGVIQQSGSWRSVADLPKVEASLERIIELDEYFEHGQAHLYLGVIRSQIPPALGGKPEVGKEHFERALTLSEGKDLMVKVMYARYYARLTFNEELHHRLLTETLAADPVADGLTLSNTLAQQQARELLQSAKDYF